MHSRKPQVLLVDDDPTILRILSKSLASDGYEVRVAEDGEEAFAAIQADCPDYLITDWEMPRLDGLELCRRVRDERLPHYVYILFLTGHSSSEELIEGLGAGADDFLAKPVVRGELLARLRAGGRVLDLERRLSEMAHTDPLTGIPTRRAFFEQFDRELARALRHRLPLSCVMIDVDYFKKINDLHGHAAGDAVLKAVAAKVQQCCRASDYACRYGGEEFCVLLTETAENAACVWAERVRIAVASLQIPANDTTLSVTASFGVAELRDDTRVAAMLVDLADQALLVAKQSGRHRVVPYRLINDTAALRVPGTSGRADPFQNLQARNVMTSLVACLREDETIGTAAEFFLRFRINSSPVVDDHGKLVGILSEKDVIGLLMAVDCWNHPISDVMKRNVVCYEESTPVKVIYDFLCRVTIRRVIIVKDGYPTGIISRGTLLRWYSTWLAVHHPKGCEAAAGRLAASGNERRRGLVDTAQSLFETASQLHGHLESDDEDFVPMIIDAASRMQESINDLLADSRHLLDASAAARRKLPYADGSLSLAGADEGVGVGSIEVLESLAKGLELPA
jgi:diguanylate cyclase (GGDEF)-like protein